MISNQIIQSTIEGIKNISRVEICVMDVEGKVAATTFEDAVEYEHAVISFVDSPADSQEVQGVQFFKVFDENHLEFVTLVKGESEDIYMIGKIMAFQLQSLLVAYKERYDKDNFIKNLLLDNLLRVDIYNRAKKLHIETNARRVVFIIEHQDETEDVEHDNNSLEVVRSLFASKT
ncbi:MAG: PucR family transcriptional regulator, partial [Lachnospiraceae bacterium]|nr:PucR family transcriptional regulator [Lachnospiraceae bacterium]